VQHEVAAYFFSKIVPGRAARTWKYADSDAVRQLAISGLPASDEDWIPIMAPELNLRVQLRAEYSAGFSGIMTIFDVALDFPIRIMSICDVALYSPTRAHHHQSSHALTCVPPKAGQRLECSFER